MIPVTVREVEYGSPLYDETVELRTLVLRKPLGLGFTPEYLKTDAQDTHIAAYASEVLVGCCILARLNDTTFRLRQMAVAPSHQGRSVGEQIVASAEKLAMAKGATSMVVKSRETAIGFYEKCGYVRNGEIFIEVTIPHLTMVKTLR